MTDRKLHATWCEGRHYSWQCLIDILLLDCHPTELEVELNNIKWSILGLFVTSVKVMDFLKVESVVKKEKEECCESQQSVDPGTP